MRKLVVHLALRLTDVEHEQLERTYAVNLEAYELRQRALELAFRGREGNAQARQLCEKAIELDPTCTLAYTCTGFQYVFEWAAQWTQDPQVLERALAYGQKAIALDDSEADYLRDGIYELRVSLQGINYRMLYFFHGDRAAVVSHGIVKERSVPPKEIDQAIVRKRRFIQDPKRYAYEEI